MYCLSYWEIFFDSSSFVFGINLSLGCPDLDMAVWGCTVLAQASCGVAYTPLPVNGTGTMIEVLHGRSILTLSSRK